MTRQNDLVPPAFALSVPRAGVAFPLAPTLGRFVEHVRSVAPVGDRARRVDRLPDGRTSFVFRELERGRGDVTVVGPVTRARLKDARGFRRAISFELKPGWSTPLLGVGASHITDRYVDIEDLWGHAGRDLLAALLRTDDLGELVERVGGAFAKRFELATEPAAAGLARRAARLFEDPSVRVEHVAARLGVTSRHLRRAFADHIGVTPRDFARSARLQRALDLSARSSSWLRVALDAGYYDQAHLNADFRELVGLTPRAFARRRRESDPA